jgi:hypothetical protein
VTTQRRARAQSTLQRLEPLRAADVAQPVAVPVALDRPHEVTTTGPQAVEDGVDVVRREGEVAQARGVRGRVPVAGGARRRTELRQLKAAMAIGRLQHRDLHADAVQADDALDPVPRDRALALPLEPERDEERRRRGEVADHDAHVLHAPDRHVPDRDDDAARARTAWRMRWSRSATSVASRAASAYAAPAAGRSPPSSCR